MLRDDRRCGTSRGHATHTRLGVALKARTATVALSAFAQGAPARPRRSSKSGVGREGGRVLRGGIRFSLGRAPSASRSGTAAPVHIVTRIAVGARERNGRKRVQQPADSPVV